MLTTAQAAEVAGITPAAFRREMLRLRQRTGTDLRLPIHRWPDARTPLYDKDAVIRWIASRPGRGTRTDITKENAMVTLQVDATAGAVESVLRDTFPGRYIGVTDGRYAQVTVTTEDAKVLRAELREHGYKVF